MLTQIFKPKRAEIQHKRRKSFVTGIIIAGLSLFSTAGVLPTGMVKKAHATVTNGVEVLIEYPNKYISPQAYDVFGTAKVTTGGGQTFHHYNLYWGEGTNPTGWSTDYFTIPDVYSQITDASLGTWDATLLTAGDYVLRVEVTSWNGTGYDYTHYDMPIVIDSDMAPGWPKTFTADGAGLGWDFTTPVVEDLDNDGIKEIIVQNAFSSVYVFNKNGTVRSGFPVSFSNERPSYSRVTVADIEGNSSKEIIFRGRSTSCAMDTGNTCLSTLHVIKNDGTTLSGWTNPTFKTSDLTEDLTPALVDVDNNGKKEIVFMEPYSSTTGRIHAIKSSGSEATGFPKTVTFPSLTPPNGYSIGTFPRPSHMSAVDMDGDGNIELAYANSDDVYLYDKSGNLLSGWPKSLTRWFGDNGYRLNSAPTFGDINGDGVKEVLIMVPQGEPVNAYVDIYAWKKDGTLLTGFPYSAGPAVNTYNDYGGHAFLTFTTTNIVSAADVDNDGKDEFGIGATQMQMYDYDNNAVSRKVSEVTVVNGIHWNMPSTTPPAIVDYDGDGSFEYSSAHGLSVAMVEANGSRSWERIFYEGRIDLNEHNLDEHLIENPPVIADMDGDGRLEFIALKTPYRGLTDFHKNALYVWTLPLSNSCTGAQYSWPMLGYDSGYSGRMPVPTPPSGGSGSCAVMNPSADAYAKQTSPTNNYGNRTTVTVDYNSTSDQYVGYMKFDLASLAGKTITSATLKLHTEGDSNNNISLKYVQSGSENWNESTMNWNTRPTLTTTQIGSSFIPDEVDKWYTVDMTSAVNAKKGGWLSFGIEDSGSDGFDFSSKEGTNALNKPVLVINYQ